MQISVVKKTFSNANLYRRGYRKGKTHEGDGWSANDPFILSQRMNLSYRIIKRFVDLAISSTSLIVLFPVFAFITLAVRLTSPGPIFYPCKEIGQGGRRFVYYKFRTMVVHADKLREQLGDRNEMTGPFFKMKNDPRVTPTGRILRKFSIDELPQLWSVIKGDMSLIGPRPTQVIEYELLSNWQKQRVCVKPGAVCLWHLQGKSGDFDEMVELDMKYIENWSIWLDITILVRTAWYIMSGKNS